jgi:protein-S-isoprenylcysteine O-methyltransferase Ste14
LGIGRREDPSSRWIFIPLIIIAIVFAWLPPHLDRLNRWSIDGDAIRYLGLIITAVGGFVRVATVFELGHRFSIFVALQPDHRLKTDSFYRFVRHPSYLGALLAMAGWALVFRSTIGLLLTAAMCVPIIARIRAEEEFLVREFGGQYRAYQQRTRWRLFPSFQTTSTSKSMLTTPFTFAGFRMLPPRIGEQSPAARHKRPSDGLCCATRSITRRRPCLTTKSCFAPGWAKRPGSPSNDLPKSGARAMANSCHKHAPSGAR